MSEARLGDFDPPLTDAEKTAFLAGIERDPEVPTEAQELHRLIVRRSQPGWTDTDEQRLRELYDRCEAGINSGTSDDREVLQARAGELRAATVTPKSELTRPWLPGRLARIDEIAALEENWDGYHALPITSAAVDVARSLVHLLSAWHTVNPGLAPQLYPTVEGGVQVEWAEQGYGLEVTVESDGRITGWLQRVADGGDVEWGDPDA